MLKYIFKGIKETVPSKKEFKKTGISPALIPISILLIGAILDYYWLTTPLAFGIAIVVSLFPKQLVGLMGIALKGAFDVGGVFIKGVFSFLGIVLEEIGKLLKKLKSRKHGK